MILFLKNDTKRKERDRKRNTQAFKIWLALTISGAIYITIFGDWNEVGTGNVFQFYTAGLGLIIYTTSNIIAIWKK